MNRPKAQGTRWETTVKNTIEASGLPAKRISEGGVYDLGDIEVLTDSTWILEAKHCQNLNVHATLEKAAWKARDVTPLVAVVWKRLLKKGPNEARRKSAGPPVVAMSMESFLYLLHRDTEGEEV